MLEVNTRVIPFNSCPPTLSFQKMSLWEACVYPLMPSQKFNSWGLPQCEVWGLPQCEVWGLSSISSPLREVPSAAPEPCSYGPGTWPSTGQSPSAMGTPATWAWHPPSGWAAASNTLDLGV